MVCDQKLFVMKKLLWCQCAYSNSVYLITMQCDPRSVTQWHGASCVTPPPNNTWLCTSLLIIIIYKIIGQYFIFQQYKIVYYVRIIYKLNVNIYQMSDIGWNCLNYMWSLVLNLCIKLLILFGHTYVRNNYIKQNRKRLTYNWIKKMLRSLFLYEYFKSKSSFK